MALDFLENSRADFQGVKREGHYAWRDSIFGVEFLVMNLMVGQRRLVRWISSLVF